MEDRYNPNHPKPAPRTDNSGESFRPGVMALAVEEGENLRRTCFEIGKSIGANLGAHDQLKLELIAEQVVEQLWDTHSLELLSEADVREAADIDPHAVAREAIWEGAQAANAVTEGGTA